MSKKIGIIDSNVGNIKSLLEIIKKFSRDITFIKNQIDIKKCNRIIFPGVGTFDSGIKLIKDKKIIKPLTNYINNNGHFLGICLGMHILFKSSEESENKVSSNCGLNIIKKKIKKIQIEKNTTLPHIGWNRIIFENIKGRKKDSLKIFDKKNFYFVHKYSAEFNKNDNGLFFNYGTKKYLALMKYKSAILSQFHPELSGKNGLEFLDFFLNYNE